jgi:TP901 family phage tail tape measure protein
MAQKIRGVTIEIGGDSTGLQKALKEVNSSISATARQLKDVNNLLKLDPGNTELLKQKQTLLANEISDVKKKIEEEKKALAEMNEQNGTEAATEGQMALQRDIIASEQKLKELERQARESASVIGTQFQLAGEKIKNVGDGISNVGEKLLPVTAAIGAAGTAAVKTAADFDSSMSQVAATMGYTVDELNDETSDAAKTMKQLSDFAQEMGASTAFSASEAADALNYMALAGYDAETSMKMLPNVLNLAAAGGMDLASASDMVTDSQSALGLSLEQTGKLIDQMAKASSKTNTSVSQLGEAILSVGGTAKNLAYGTEELTGVLGVLADNGIKGAEAGTHLRNIMLSLNPTTDAAIAAFNKLGINAYTAEGELRGLDVIFGEINESMKDLSDQEKTELLSKMFNKTDLSSVNALLATTSERWTEVYQALDFAEGAAQNMADTQLNNLNGQITLLKSAVEGLMITIGEIVMPYITQLVGYVQALVDKFNGLDEEHQKMIVAIAAIVAALGPALIIVGKVVSFIGTIVSSIGTVITVITAVGSFLVSTLIPAIAGIVVALGPVLLIIAAVAAAVVGAIAIIRNWGAISEWLSEKWTEAKENLSEIWDSMKEHASNAFNAAKETITSIFTSLFESAPGWAQNLIMGYINIIKAEIALVKRIFTDLKEKGIKQTFIDLINDAKQWASDFINGFIQGIKDKISAVRDAVSGVASTIASYLHFSVPEKGALHQANTWMPDFMELLADTMSNSLNILDPALNQTAEHIAALSNIAVSANNADVINYLAGALPGLGNQQIVLDTGALVGQTVSQYNDALGKLYVYDQRSI